ncbi:MAG TPA: ribosome biogenesis GTP-binding protein YihA/YsxC [Verrucomicrobiae bacterium]|nr:ribosome biogenesis GTP-binding protein YihA/YsxC [Verrucomicrobiae bacterium]
MSEAVFLKSYSDPKAVPHDGAPQVAILGRSNAGKSSLINSLAGTKDLAKTSATPGRTQLINLFKFDNEFVLVDLPGYGYAEVPGTKKETLQSMIIGYLEEAGPLAGAIVVTDSRLGTTKDDENMIKALEDAGIFSIIVANKIDKLSRSERAERLRQLSEQYPSAVIVSHSNVNGEGRGELLQEIRKRVMSFKKDGTT